MEGDAKGQVGGMEMPKAERERLAKESLSWSCVGCGGRSNEEILEEEGRGGDSKQEHTVPQELKFDFRDQMIRKEMKTEDKGKRKESAPSSSSETENAASSVLQSVHPTQAVPISIRSPPVMDPTALIPQPTPTTAPLTTRDGVPAWIDKAITGVMAALAVMIIKKILV